VSTLDTSVIIHDFRAGSPLGLAPGPLTATPDLVLEAYRQGARIFEIRPDHIEAATAGRQLIENTGGHDFIFDINLSAEPFDLPYRHPFHCATISCFHQGPAAYIERAARQFWDKYHLPISLKFSPIMLGGDDIRYLLHERIGLTHLDISPRAGENEISFDDAIALVHKLPGVAVKFSNVLEVVDRRSSQEMYLAGPPLHLIALRLAEKWRQNFGPTRPVGFSAGVTAENFPDCVACGFAPITACTDLLGPGGVSRLQSYRQNLHARMRETGSLKLSDFILRAENNAAFAAQHLDPVSYCALLNTGPIFGRAISNPKYNFTNRNLVPHQMGTHLWLSA
jgi:hypothetical protein